MTTLDDLWQCYTAHGYTGARALEPSDALGQFYLALLAFNADAFADAAAYAHHAASQQPGSRVFRQAAVYLDRVIEHGKAGVYVDGEAFAAFIRGGSNVALYAAISDALRTVYAQYDALALLDIGVGDGLALLPALTDSLTQPEARLDLLEPSDAMLARTSAELAARGVPHHTHQTTLQNFMQQPAAQQHWDIIQATWSLQSIPPEDRPDVFAWLRAHTDRALIAEFDVPDFAAMLASDRVRYVVARYENGLAEYADDGGLVAQGFLMPVMFGYFDRSAARTNWEGPIEEWVAALRAAGFTQIATQHLYRYFWADSLLIDAR